MVHEVILERTGQVLAESTDGPSSDAAVVETIIRTKFPDRTRKFPAPEFLQPTGRWTPSDSVNRLSTATLRLIERLQSASGLRRHCLPAPPLNATTNGEHKSMDGYHWILTAAAHTDRHTAQILEVKADPGFPAG